MTRAGMRQFQVSQPEMCCHLDCYREPVAKKLCWAHYKRLLRGQSIASPIKIRRKMPRLTLEIIEEEMDAGFTIAELAEAYGVKPDSIKRTLQRRDAS